MSRYDWPRTPKRPDAPALRAEHKSRLRPAADPATLPAVPAQSARRRTASRAVAVAHDAPAGAQNLWFPIGPSAMTKGQAGGEPNVAGRIRDLEVEPVAGQRLYAASASGGVWFSRNAGTDWAPLDDFAMTTHREHVGLVANSLACGAIHVIWGGQADGSADEVWVGTGELGGGASELPGGQVAGVGFLHRTGGAWSLVKGDLPGTGVDTLRGQTVFRITGDPTTLTQLVAATSNGVYVLPPGGSWTQVPGWPGQDDILHHRPLDVVVTRGGGKLRVWVAVRSGLFVADCAPGQPLAAASMTFTPVTLGNVSRSTRIALAASADGATVYVLGRRPKTAAETRKTPAAHLWSVNAAAATVPASATEQPGVVPVDLFMSADDQSDYDMAICTHPTKPGRIYVGGATVATGTGWNAAIYRCETSVVPPTATPIGEGVHADVHVLKVGPALTGAPKNDFWVGCDGGVFTSATDGDAGTFLPRNDGLAVLEAGFVASHPSNPGIAAAGFQDNGTGIRIGDTVWREQFKGDGGGLVWDPDLGLPAKSRFMAQYTYASWQATDGTLTQPVLRHSAAAAAALTGSESDESTTGQFYMGADAVSTGPGETHVILGTDRVWYSRLWGALVPDGSGGTQSSWVTLPTGSDPRASANPNRTQDVLKPQLTADGSTCSSDPPSLPSGIIAVKFAMPNPTATASLIRVLALYPGGLVWLTGSRPLASTGPYTWTVPTKDAPVPTQAFRAPKDSEKTAYDAGNALTFLPAPGIVSDFAVHDPNRGPLGSCYVTTTGLSDFAPGTPGARVDTLWFFDGTSDWIPCGLRTDNPTGHWTGDRVSAPALGVVVDSHDGDRSTVYVATSVGVVKGVLTIGGGPSYTWEWSQFVNGLPEAAVQDLSVHSYGSSRLLRAALQARGVWETDLATPTVTPLTYLRAYPSDTRRILPTPLTGPTVVGEATPPRWDASPDIVLDVSGAPLAPQTESSLLNLPSAGAPLAGVALQLSNRTPRIYVLVHHRWSAPAEIADVRVTLLRHALPANGTVPLGGLWPVLVAAAAAPTPPAVLPDGWAVASDQFWQSPSAPVDARMPRAATFTCDFSGAANPAGTRMVLLAVVASASNPISSNDLAMVPAPVATTVDQLVSASPHVAAMTIQLA